ncbi:MAG: glutamine amidotransferase, partial [Candidatus Omnitrophica bacterium]|nr:glutamine amidotransferase [Candidatus Omnitrophota bacterium]
MKKVLVFRHVPHEGLGTLETFLSRNQFSIEYLDLFRNSQVPKSSQAWDFFISMGGPMNADETQRYPFLQSERDLICDAIKKGKRVFGICLGAQMIARALEARVYAGQKKEIGWYSIRLSRWAKEDPAFQSIRDSNPTVFQWHGDTFDLPKGSTLLASSDLYPNQAFRFGQSVYALQFHIEMTG